MYPGPIGASTGVHMEWHHYNHDKSVVIDILSMGGVKPMTILGTVLDPVSDLDSDSLPRRVKRQDVITSKVTASLFRVSEPTSRLVQGDRSTAKAWSPVIREWAGEKGDSTFTLLPTAIYYVFLKEFATLTQENTVYKLIGPVLVKQDQAEAKSNVDTRLDFIRGEMSEFPSRYTDLLN